MSVKFAAGAGSEVAPGHELAGFELEGWSEYKPATSERLLEISGALAAKGSDKAVGFFAAIGEAVAGCIHRRQKIPKRERY